MGEPTSSLPSGVTVAAFSPKPASRIARAASWTISLPVSRRFSSDEVVVVELEVEAQQLGVEHPHGLLEQLLAGLVPFEDDDLQRVRHRAGRLPRR